jgi:hypothetical protein
MDEVTATGEVWRPVADYAGAYEVSDLGRVRSVARAFVDARGRTHRRPGRVLRLGRHKDGYAMVDLSRGGAKRCLLVHRLVAGAFLPNPEQKAEVNHRDGNKTNNRLGNLEWATRPENMRHAFAAGLYSRGKGSDALNAKLTEGDIPTIRARLAAGHSQRSVARDYGVSKHTIYSIQKGLTWLHV